jgi:hypothetical protein
VLYSPVPVYFWNLRLFCLPCYWKSRKQKSVEGKRFIQAALRKIKETFLSQISVFEG